MKECNQRGAAHIHGQHHGGLTPLLLSYLAGDPELQALAIAALLGTQLEAEMPLEYHLVDIARRNLRIGARRDAAADIPRPSAELPQEKPPEGMSDMSKES